MASLRFSINVSWCALVCAPVFPSLSLSPHPVYPCIGGTLHRSRGRWLRHRRRIVRSDVWVRGALLSVAGALRARGFPHQVGLAC
jgi:hypothetical protein